MYKVKTHWYFDRTKKEKQDYSMNSERNIWLYILDQQLDDALGFMNDPILEQKSKEFEIVLWDAIEKSAAQVEKIVQDYKATASSDPSDRKAFSDWVKANHPPEMASLLFGSFEGKKTPQMLVVDYVKGKCKNPKDLDVARKLLGGIRFIE